MPNLNAPAATTATSDLNFDPPAAAAVSGRIGSVPTDADDARYYGTEAIPNHTPPAATTATSDLNFDPPVAAAVS